MPADVFDAICEAVAQGASIPLAAELRGYTDRTVYRHAKADPERQEQIRAALDARRRAAMDRHGVVRRGCCERCTEAARKASREAVARWRRRKAGAA